MILRSLSALLLFSPGVIGQEPSRSSRYQQTVSVEFKGESSYDAIKKLCDTAGIDYAISPTVRIRGEKSRITGVFAGMKPLDTAYAIGASFGGAVVSYRIEDNVLIVGWRESERRRLPDYEAYIRGPEPEPRITLRLDNEPGMSALLRILETAGVNYVLPELPALKGSVTQSFVNEPLESALRGTIKELGGDSVKVGRVSNTYVIWHDQGASNPQFAPVVTARFRDEDFRYCIKALMLASQKNYVLDVQARGLVNARFRDLNWRGALESVLRIQNEIVPLTYRVEDGVYTISPRQ